MNSDIYNALLEKTRDNPNDPSAWAELGLLYLSNHLYANSLEALEKAVQLDQKNTDYYFNLASVQHILGNFDQALKSYEKSISLDAENVYSLCGLSEIYIQTKEFATAKTLLDKANTKFPDDPEVLCTYVKYSLNIKDVNSAIDYSNRLRVIVPNNSKMFAYISLQFDIYGLYDKAIEFLKYSIDIDPLNVEYLYDYGSILNKVHKYNYAISILEKVLAINENHIQSLDMLGQLYFNTFNYDKAISVYNTLLNATQDNKYNIFISLCLVSSGKYKDSIPYLIQASKKDKTNAEYTYFIAMSYLSINNRELARKYFSKARTILKNYSNQVDRIFITVIPNLYRLNCADEIIHLACNYSNYLKDTEFYNLATIFNLSIENKVKIQLMRIQIEIWRLLNHFTIKSTNDDYCHYSKLNSIKDFI